jgi:hypothetical protein
MDPIEEVRALVAERNDVYSMTDALVYCMEQPGVLAVAFVDMQTGKAIAGDGIQNLDIDTYTPFLTEMFVNYCNLYGSGVLQHDMRHSSKDQESGLLRPEGGIELLINTTGRVHIMYSLSDAGEGLYLYLAMDRATGHMALGRRCMREVDSRLHL